MASSKKSQPLVSAPTARKPKRKVPRASVVQSAMIGRSKINHNESHCPYQKGSEAAELWLKVFKTGQDPESEEIGTVVARKETEE